MSAPLSNTHLRVPPGFANILWCFAREVLRVQPNDILNFGMDYFESLLRIRLETGEEDIAKLGAASDDRYYNNRTFMMSTPGANLKRIKNLPDYYMPGCKS